MRVELIHVWVTEWPKEYKWRFQGFGVRGSKISWLKTLYTCPPFRGLRRYKAPTFPMSYAVRIRVSNFSTIRSASDRETRRSIEKTI